MGGLDLEYLLENSASESVQVWLKSPEDNGLDSLQVDARQALKLHRAGHSLYCRAPSDLEAMVVPRMLHGLGYGPRPLSGDRFSRGEIEMFFSREGHLTDFHSDFQENLTVQLSGSKRWVFGESPLDHPLRGMTPHFDNSQDKTITEQQLKVAKIIAPAFELNHVPKGNGSSQGMTEAVLLPGDVLYHPAGVWHRVVCEQDSVSMNVSLTVSSYADVVCCGLLQLLSKSNVFRAGVRTGRGDVEYSLGVVKELLVEVPRIIEALRPEDFLPPTVFYDHAALPAAVEEESEEVEEEDAIDTAEVNAEDLEDVPNYDLVTLYVLNPLTTLLFTHPVEEDSKDVNSDFIVHSVFGNENFESMNRVKCWVRIECLPLLKVIETKRDNSFSFQGILEEAGLTLSRERKRKRGGKFVDNESVYRLIHLLLMTGAIRTW